MPARSRALITGMAAFWAVALALSTGSLLAQEIGRPELRPSGGGGAQQDQLKDILPKATIPKARPPEPTQVLTPSAPPTFDRPLIEGLIPNPQGPKLDVGSTRPVPTGEKPSLIRAPTEIRNLKELFEKAKSGSCPTCRTSSHDRPLITGLQFDRPPSLDQPVTGDSAQGRVASAASQPPGEQAKLEAARAYRRFLQKHDPAKMLCRVIAELIDANVPTGACVLRNVNRTQSAFFQVTTENSAGLIYRLELVGNSEWMALGNRAWTERHRFVVSFGFDGDLEPLTTVHSMQPMLRTTSVLLPISENEFRYMSREDDDKIEAFTSVIKGAIAEALKADIRQVSAR